MVDPCVHVLSVTHTSSRLLYESYTAGRPWKKGKLIWGRHATILDREERVSQEEGVWLLHISGDQKEDET
jgi:hypothetical protein